jgi:deoxycytidine triphosphate deaminase
MTPDENYSLRREKEVERLRKLRDRQPTNEQEFSFQGVLLSDAIEQCAAGFGLITPFSKDNLKPASYKLTIGDEYAIDGKIMPLLDESGRNRLVIPSFAVAIIKTRETVNMPRFLIGRWNIQVARAYEGLLWVGGPQVDPGYVGYLFCPIYNLRDKAVELKRGEPIAVIDFVRTSAVPPAPKLYPFPPKRILFEDYEPETLVSGLVTGAKKRIEQFELQLNESTENTRKQLSDASASTRRGFDQIGSRIDNFVLITFSIIAVLFAAVTIFVTRTEQSYWWNPALFLVSGIAIFISAQAWIRTSQDQRVFGRLTQAIIIALLLIATALQMKAVGPLQSQITDLKSQISQLRQQLEGISSTPRISPQQLPPTPASTATTKEHTEKK